MARFTLPREDLLWLGCNRRIKKSERLQKGNDPHRRQFYEKGRFFAEGRRYPA